jgi:hypothetical protein
VVESIANSNLWALVQVQVLVLVLVQVQVQVQTKPQDVVRLMNVLIIRFNLDCTLQKDKEHYRIYISSKSMPYLRSIVTPYFHFSMLYKQGL